jgi:uncharacterized repeat protein (TIGR04076 family)
VEYEVKGKIIKVGGECATGHYVGEEFDLTLSSKEETRRTPMICPFLYDVMFPYLMTLQFGGAFPWQTDRDVIEIGCPDNQKVVIQIRRIKK